MPMDPTLEHADSLALADEAARGRAADRDLAGRLDRPPPHGPGFAARNLDALSHRASEADRELLEAAKAHDRRALEAVVRAYLPRVAALSRRFQARNVERTELTQEGVAALLQALERYDPSQGTPFWAYARPTVERAMRRLVAELGDAVVLGDHALRRLSRLRTAEQELMQERRRLPSGEEIVERAGVKRETAEQVLAGGSTPRSLQEPILTREGDVIGLFGDLVDDPRAQDAYDRVLDEVEAQELLPLLAVLSDRERRILEWHHGLDGEAQTQTQIAECLGISVSRVRQIERRALAPSSPQRAG